MRAKEVSEFQAVIRPTKVAKNLPQYVPHLPPPKKAWLKFTCKHPCFILMCV